MNKLELLQQLILAKNDVHFITVGDKKDEDIKIRLMELLKIPKTMDPMTVIEVLMNMKIDGMQSATSLGFPENTDPKIIRIIEDAFYKYFGLDNSDLLNCHIVNSNGEPLNAAVKCFFKDLPNMCQDILPQYQDSYLVVDGDIDLRKISSKKIKLYTEYMDRFIVKGNFYCNKNVKVFPHKVEGVFDCHSLGKNYINQDVKLPITDVINCAYSITDFDVLMDILPNCLVTLIVEPKLITKDFLGNKEHYENVKKFVEKYPLVIVTDSSNKYYLHDTLLEFEGGKKQEPVKTENSLNQKENNANNTFKKTQSVPQKQKGKDLTVMDLLMYCRSIHVDGVYTYRDFDDSELRNFIKSALKYTNLKKKRVVDIDGNVYDSIDFSEFFVFVKNLDSVIAEFNQKQQKEESGKPQQIKSRKTSEKPKSHARMPIEIKKYIRQDQFDEIAKSVKQDTALQLLRDVQEINLNPLDVKSSGNGRSIPMIKNGVETTVPNITKYGGCCLRQKVKSKSIIWHVANNAAGNVILVCVGFSTNSNKMQELINCALKMKTYTDEELFKGKYVDIDTIISEQNLSNLYDELSQQSAANMLQNTTPVH